jgi:spermidine synthase
MSWFMREEACSSDIVSLYPVNHVYWAKKTPFADALIADCPGLGKTLFLDREIQSAEVDEDIYHECLVHPVMASAPFRTRVLVIGGGEGATVREVLRWEGVEQVTWVDIDGELVEACREHLGWTPAFVYEDPRVQYHATDIRQFLQHTRDMFDVVIVDLPDPDPADAPADPDCLINVAFWQALQEHLAPEGVFVTHCGPVRRQPTKSGKHWIRDAACMAGIHLPDEGTYHAVIASFQDDWGYWMSCKPRFDVELPSSLRFLTKQAYRYIFQWP